MAGAAGIGRIGGVLLADHLLAGGHVPEAELDLQPTTAITHDAAGHEALHTRRPPLLEIRGSVEGRIFGKTRPIEGGEIARTAQVVGHHAADEAAQARIATEFRHRDRHGLEAAAADPQLKLRLRGPGEAESYGGERQESQEVGRQRVAVPADRAVGHRLGRRADRGTGGEGAVPGVTSP